MRKNRINLAGFRKAWRLPVKLIIATLIIFLALSFIIGYIWKVSVSADYFTIKDIVTRGANRVDLSYLTGKNIFSVDLKQEAGYILESFSDYSNIKVVRVLPDRLFIDFIKRKPVAFVKLYRYFALDKEGVLFYGPQDPQELELPVISGLETKIFGPKPGKKYNIKEIELALNIIREVKRNGAFKKYKITKIDIANPANTSIFISLTPKAPDYSRGGAVAAFENLEVKIGQDNIKEKIIILAGLIGQEKSDLNNIKYIDLRFKEPVIKLKDAK